MVTKVKQADSTASSASPGRRLVFNMGIVVSNLNCKNLRKPFGTQRLTRECQTSEKAGDMFTSLPVNSQQYPLVCIVQCHWQLIPSTPNARPKTTRQCVRLTDNPSEPASFCESPQYEILIVMPYIPLAFCDGESTWIPIRLSAQVGTDLASRRDGVLSCC